MNDPNKLIHIEMDLSMTEAATLAWILKHRVEWLAEQEKTQQHRWLVESYRDEAHRILRIMLKLDDALGNPF